MTCMLNYDELHYDIDAQKGNVRLSNLVLETASNVADCLPSGLPQPSVSVAYDDALEFDFSLNDMVVAVLSFFPDGRVQLVHGFVNWFYNIGFLWDGKMRPDGEKIVSQLRYYVAIYSIFKSIML